MVADVIEKKANIKLNKIKFNSLTAITTIGEQQVLLMKPQTYMNLSGGAVKQAMRFYKVPLDRIIVISDETSLPIGKLRIRRSGSAGGHNGLRDIIIKCGGEDFPRIRIGVDAPPHEDYDMADWVLSKTNESDRKLLREAAQNAETALETIITQGIDKAMSKYN
jgi:PTH1 family peptidyl-tRNA hydrolase